MTTAISGEFTSRDLNIESLEESLVIARENVATAPEMMPAMAPAANPFTTMCAEMDAQRKQFKIQLKQN